jgi:hypothetical protein
LSSDDPPTGNDGTAGATMPSGDAGAADEFEEEPESLDGHS